MAIEALDVRLGDQSAVAQIYSGAAKCYEAIAEQLSSASGQYFFGSHPSSIDALLYGHLALHISAPIAVPELRAAVSACSGLNQYYLLSELHRCLLAFSKV